MFGVAVSGIDSSSILNFEHVHPSLTYIKAARFRVVSEGSCNVAKRLELIHRMQAELSLRSLPVEIFHFTKSEISTTTFPIKDIILNVSNTTARH